MNFWSSEKMQRYENVMLLLIQNVDAIDGELYQKTGNHIIRHKERRLKSEESIAEKCKRKCGNVDINQIENIINDLAGVRVICYDTKQVYRLVKEVRKIKGFNVLKEKDYINKPKENGYQSYHMILEFLNAKVELQIRTILMDAWSSLDTVLVYKKANTPPKDVLSKVHQFSKWSKKMDRMVEEMLEARG